MTDETAPEAANDSPAGVTPTQAVADLTRSPAWSENFSGVNGREAQKQAVEQKSAILRPADTPRDVPEALADGLQNPVTQPFAEARMPAETAAEYKFDRWDGVESIEEAQAMTTIAQEAAHAIGAAPQFAKATVSHVQERLSRVADGSRVSDNVDAFDAALTKAFGERTDATVAAAEAALNAMPKEGRKWVQSALNNLDPESASWFVGRLASATRARLVRAKLVP
ncbi:MAG: hypothetical protein HOK11_03285 [Rhodospirillaceae bacterium]|jgi:hypothetical protein|nr:hypothetical protein [Rhodospirillaceae bacterium]